MAKHDAEPLEGFLRPLRKYFPTLRGGKESVAKLVLQEILEPSKAIEERYRNVTLELGDENSLSGLILAEDKDSVTLQTGPTAAQVQKVAKTTIKSRKPSALSLMPAGLLNTLGKEQILDLLAYLLAEGKADQAAFKHAH